MVRLMTDGDVANRDATIARLTQDFSLPAVRVLPDTDEMTFSFRIDGVTYYRDLKIRKEALSDMEDRYSSGIIYRVRKVKRLASLTRAGSPASVIFAFENGTGDIRSALTKDLLTLQPNKEGWQRANGRNHSSDHDPVVLVPWSMLFDPYDAL